MQWRNSERLTTYDNGEHAGDLIIMGLVDRIVRGTR